MGLHFMASEASNRHPISRHTQSVILGSLRGLKPRTVVSSRRLIARVREEEDECMLDDEELAGLIREAALLLGLVPVYVREHQETPPEEMESFERRSSDPAAGARGSSTPPRH